MKIHKIILIILIIITSCKESPTPPEEQQEEILPQQDIEWPSLAKTPWPMNHGNPQSTGRSAFEGPLVGEIISRVPYNGVESSLVLGQNNEIYLTANYYPHRFSALTIDGDIIWEELANGNIATTPLLTDSSIYWADASGLYAYNYKGSMKWKYDDECSIFNVGINIGLDGVIYCVTVDNVLMAINPQGKLLWKLKDERFRGDEQGAPTFSPDGETLYIQGNSVSVLAVDINLQTIKWIFGDYEQMSSPVVDSYGNIYIIPGNYQEPSQKLLYALDPDGQEIWEFPFYDEYIFDNTEPTIDYDGNIYFGGDTVYSVNYKGNLNWKHSLGNLNIISPLISDINRNIFIGAADLNNPAVVSVLSFNKKGEKKWEVPVSGNYLLGASPVISNSGQLLFPLFRGNDILIIN